MLKNISGTVCLILTAILLMLFPACVSKGGLSEKNGLNAQEEIKTVKIAYLPITHAVLLYIENELSNGKFRHFSLELVKFGSWTELAEALNAGKVDGALMLIELAVKAKEQGIDLKAVALGHRDGNVVIVSENINSVEDLRGKTFAIPSKLSTHNILLHILLENNGLSYSDVNVVELPPPEMPAALAEGRIAGYCVAEPFGAQSVIAGKGKKLFESRELWEGSLCCGLILRSDFIKNNPGVVEEFVKEYVKAGVKAELKNEEVKNATSKYLKTNPDVLDLSLQWISYNDLRLEEDDYNELVNYMIELGLSENPPGYEEFVDNSFIDR
nr:ABC transporter substrate-binding protein [Thermoclostridium stercorarium]